MNNMSRDPIYIIKNRIKIYLRKIKDTQILIDNSSRVIVKYNGIIAELKELLEERKKDTLKFIETLDSIIEDMNELLAEIKEENEKNNNE